MRYEWDEEKSLLNQKKHGVSFEVAALAFEDENCLVRLDRVDQGGEQRWRAIGVARDWGGATEGRHSGRIVRRACLQGGNRWRRNHTHHLGPQG